MERSQIKELHFIAPLANLPSLIERGILSNRKATSLPHSSVAKPGVQTIRASKSLPGGRPLHEYANLYVSARNAMLYKVLGFPAKPPTNHLDIVVLAIDPAVLDLEGAAIADGNAAGQLTSFWPVSTGLVKLDRSVIYADFWTDPDPAVALKKKQAMMAEVLVPDTVPPTYIRGAYCCCTEAKKRAEASIVSLKFTINRKLFFNNGERKHD